MKSRTLKLLGLGLSLLISHAALANPNEAEQRKAWDAANKAAQKGPAQISIADQATLNLGKQYYFVPAAQAQALMRSMGNSNNPQLLGLIVPNAPEDNSILTVEYSPEGYVKDDEAKDLNPTDILKSYQEGTEEANKERASRGFTQLEVTGWAQKPTYDASKHRLTWAMLGHDKGAATAENDGINYETRLLGREGVISITLLADAKELKAAAPKADAITAQVNYNEGKKYENFSASAGDKVAEYGLAALITGAVAKKLGLFALIAAFLAKFAKFAIIGVFALFPFLKKIFKKKETPNPTEPTVAAQAEHPVLQDDQQPKASS